MLAEFIINLNIKLKNFTFGYIFDRDGKLFIAERCAIPEEKSISQMSNHWKEALIQIGDISSTIDFDFSQAIGSINSVDSINFIKEKLIFDFEDIFAKQTLFSKRGDP